MPRETARTHTCTRRHTRSPRAHEMRQTTKAVRGKRCTETPQPPLTTGISKTEAGQSLPALTLPKAAQLCPLRQRDPGKLHDGGAQAERSHAPVPFVPLEDLPLPPLTPPAGLCLPLLLQPKPGTNEQLPELQTKAAIWECKPRQRVRGVGSLDRDPAPHSQWHPGNTSSTMVPTEPPCTKLAPACSGRPAVSKTRAQAGLLGPRHQLRCHLLLPSQPSRAPAGAGGFESPLCIYPPTDSHSSFPSSLEDPLPCWAAQASVGQNGTSPPNVPPKVSVPLEGGGVSELAFAPLQLTGWRSGWRNFSPAHHRSAASFPKATQLMQ